MDDEASKLPDDVIEALREGTKLPDPKLQALYDYTKKPLDTYGQSFVGVLWRKI